MRFGIWFMLAAVLVAGCMQTDENPGWDPRNNLPPWAYDAPYYYRPTEDIKPAETIGSGIEVYYVPTEYFFIKHPNNCQLPGVPRVGVWYSTDRGQHWQLAGFYGVEQSHFLFQADQEGPQWIRFVGPAQNIKDIPPGVPHRIYVVDRASPRITVLVDPSPVEKDKDGKKRPHLYHVGDKVKLTWRVTDSDLVDDPKPVHLGIAFAKFPDNLLWYRWQEKLPPNGEMEIVLPPFAAKKGGMKFRIEAKDKAGNVGLGVSEVMYVLAPKTTSAPVVAMDESTKRWEVVEPPGDKLNPLPGWPKAGVMLTSGTKQKLEWLPDGLADYETARMEFTSNNGMTWQIVATDLENGKTVEWVVPKIVSTDKRCRVRVVGVRTNEEGEEVLFMLAMSQPFTVSVVRPPVIIGPEEIREPILTPKNPE